MADRMNLATEPVLLLLLSTLWGASWIFIKIGAGTIPPATRTAAGTLVARLIRLIFHVWPDRRRQRRDLREMGAHRLHDLGISRSEALREARKPFWR